MHKSALALITAAAVTACSNSSAVGTYECNDHSRITLGEDGMVTFASRNFERKVPYKLADATTLQIFYRDGEKLAQVLRIEGVNIVDPERPRNICTKVGG